MGFSERNAFMQQNYDGMTLQQRAFALFCSRAKDCYATVHLMWRSAVLI